MRTAVALSAVHGVKVELKNIRENRDNPGLKHQHIAAIELISEMCDADIEGLEVESNELVFDPSDSISGGRYDADIGTAGSITLVLQTVLPVALSARSDCSISITGGTDVKWSPTIDYFRYVTAPLISRFGASFDVDLVRRGHYPRGGGIVDLDVNIGQDFSSIDLTMRGGLRHVSGVAQVSRLQRGIAEREREAAVKALTELDCPIEIDVREYPDAGSEGTSITLWAELDNGVIGGSCIGERGKPAEEVGEEAARELLRGLNTDGCIDRYSADQIVPYLSLFGGEIVASEATSHLETNIWLCNQFPGNQVELGRDEVDNGVVVRCRND